MPPTHPPQRTAPQENPKIRNMSLTARLVRMSISFLLGIAAFLAILVLSGNKSLSQVLDMIKSMFV